MRGGLDCVGVRKRDVVGLAGLDRLRDVPARARVAHVGGHVERAEPIDARRNGAQKSLP